MINRLGTYLSFVRFSHTVFALPFALAGALLAARRVGFEWRAVGWILVAMVSARSAAMGFNRLVDARYDALNPRTAGRELPRGAMTTREAALFVLVASMVFVGAAWQLNPVCLVLSPLALAIVFWYSLAKRFTAYTQLFLGLAMAVAPVGGWIAAGDAVAYVSDAGTPAISDPGARLVAAVRAAGHAVVPIPGVSAVTTALSAAGVESGDWLFHGFLPPKAGARRTQLQALAALPCALVFYEAPHRLVETLRDLAETLGDGRESVIARELTKRFESTYRGTLAELARRSTSDADMTRGELVILVTGASPASAAAARELRGVVDGTLAKRGGS